MLFFFGVVCEGIELVWVTVFCAEAEESEPVDNSEVNYADEEKEEEQQEEQKADFRYALFRC